MRERPIIPMVHTMAWVLGVSAICVVGLGQWRERTGPDMVHLKAAHAKTFRQLYEGCSEEAMQTVAGVEEVARTNLPCRPGTAVGVLMAKARIYSLRMDREGLERFLTQFEKECAGTAVAEQVDIVACCERAFAYRLMEDWPQAVRAMERERELLERRERARRQDEVAGLDALSRRFYLYVQAPTQVADLYRFMGRVELAAAEYRRALEYLDAHAETMRPLDHYMHRIHRESLCPCRYKEEILPRAIRDCEAGQDSPLGILARRVACEADQGDYLMKMGLAYRQRQALQAALEHYDRAQRAMEANRCAMDSLDPEDQARYLKLGQHVLKNIHVCHRELTRLGQD